uniref:Uncharacterized protein n=1 Tax=Setaria viridis TaxID=4556 RepID=A0A4V6D2V3_SETVI|nr:hypothetical protein SEVIR_8G086400v2 [Setaria viridis]
MIFFLTSLDPIPHHPIPNPSSSAATAGYRIMRRQTRHCGRQQPHKSLRRRTRRWRTRGVAVLLRADAAMIPSPRGSRADPSMPSAYTRTTSHPLGTSNGCTPFTRWFVSGRYELTK